MRLWKSEQSKGESTHEGFAIKTALRLYWSWLRKRRPHDLSWDFDEASTNCDPALMTEKAEQTLALLKLLDGLPTLYRDIVKLRFVEGWTCEEIAREKGLNINTVKTRLHRANSLLREAVKPPLLN